MENRSEIKRQFKENDGQAGIYMIKNRQNNKMFIGSTHNVRSLNGKRFELDMGGYRNKALQKEWKEFGSSNFEFDILEILKKNDSPYFDEKDALAKLEAKWLEKLQPFGDRGYNKELEG